MGNTYTGGAGLLLNGCFDCDIGFNRGLNNGRSCSIDPFTGLIGNAQRPSELASAAIRAAGVAVGSNSGDEKGKRSDELHGDGIEID